MPRTRSQRVEDVKAKLRARLHDGARAGLHRPGDKFFSTRFVAQTFGVSYQTAHRLMLELTQEGVLERRAASGSFVPGGRPDLSGALLLFNARGQRAGSFGARLFELLTRRLKREGISWKVQWLQETDAPKLSATRFPILWEVPLAVAACIETQRFGLLLNLRPPPGLGAAWLDSVAADDFSGGAAAAQLLSRGAKPRAKLAIVGGPQDDARSIQRRDGFCSVAPNAKTITADGWSFEDGLQVAARAVEAGRDGIFCCNDRLAEAILAWCQENNRARPKIIGFDDAPVAETLNLTTIAMPWNEMIAGASGVIKRRLDGDGGTSSQLIWTPRPVLRQL